MSVYPNTKYAIESMLKSRVSTARKTHLRFIGNFHSHMMVNNDLYRGASPADIVSFKDDEQALLETIIFVWNVDLLKKSCRDVAIKRIYDFRIRCYGKEKGRVRQVAVKYGGKR